MDPIFRLPQIRNLGKHSRCEIAGGTASNGVLVFPRLPLDGNGMEHFRLLEECGYLGDEGVLEVLPLFPVAMHVPAEEYKQGRLHFPLLVVLAVVESGEQRRVLAI